MSGIFGVFNRNGESVSVEILQEMQEAMAHWEPDASGLWHEDAVGLGDAMLWNTPESKLEQLPSEQDGLVISMDARLDNRDKLVQKLGLTDRPLEQIRESEFILAAYRKWGEDCPKHLIGDFSFVIWDEKKQQLFCARDHVGVKQFYYCATDAYFAFSNDLKGLVVHPLVSGDISDEAVASYLVNHQLKSPTLTIFKDAEKLPPAHSLTITAGEIKKKCYWRLEDTPRVKLPDLESYAAKLRELLEQAVHDRMRSAYPITSHLSGGLDSSSIAVIAARKLRETGEKLLAFNWLHEPGEEDDPKHYEWSNSREIAKAEGIEHHYVSLTAKEISSHIRNTSMVFGDASILWYEYPILESMHMRNARTLLSGWGGDELSTYHGQSYYSDLITQGKIVKAVKELKKIACRKKERCSKRFFSLLYHHVFLVLIPRRLYRYMPKHRETNAQTPYFVSESFLSCIQEELRKKPILTMQAHRTIKRHMLAYWENGHIQNRIESWATLGRAKKIEYSYPLLDKRILEFVIGVPVECFVNKGFGRHLFRVAVSGMLPEEMLWGNAKIESKRVERLLSLSLSAWKLLAKDRSDIDRPSKYLNKPMLFKAIENMDFVALERKSVLLSQNIQTSLSLLYSDEPLRGNSRHSYKTKFTIEEGPK